MSTLVLNGRIFPERSIPPQIVSRFYCSGSFYITVARFAVFAPCWSHGLNSWDSILGLVADFDEQEINIHLGISLWKFDHRCGEKTRFLWVEEIFFQRLRYLLSTTRNFNTGISKCCFSTCRTEGSFQNDLERIIHQMRLFFCRRIIPGKVL